MAYTKKRYLNKIHRCNLGTMTVCAFLSLLLVAVHAAEIEVDEAGDAVISVDEGNKASTGYPILRYMLDL